MRTEIEVNAGEAQARDSYKLPRDVKEGNVIAIAVISSLSDGFISQVS